MPELDIVRQSRGRQPAGNDRRSPQTELACILDAVRASERGHETIGRFSREVIAEHGRM